MAVKIKIFAKVVKCSDQIIHNGKQMDNFTAATTCKNTNTPTGSIKSENQAINMLI